MYYKIFNDKNEINVYKPFNLDNPDYIVVGVHGLAEHCGRYVKFAKFLSEKNMLFISCDLPGHGPNTKTLGQWPKDGFNLCIQNLKVLIDNIKKEYPDKQIVLFGHSMGSFISLGYLSSHSNDIHKCILSGSNDKQPGMLLLAGRSIAKLQNLLSGRNQTSKLLDKMSFGSFNLPFEPTKTIFDWISSQENEVNEYINDPYCGFISSSGLFYDFLTGLSKIYKKQRMSAISKDLPVHLLSGENDPVGNFSKGVYKLKERFLKYGLSNVSIRIYEGSRHECLNDHSSTTVMEDICSYIYSGSVSS